MSNASINYEELIHIVELLKQADHFAEFRLKVGELEVEVRRDARPVNGAAANGAAVLAAPVTAPAAAPSPAPAVNAAAAPQAVAGPAQTTLPTRAASAHSERAQRVTAPMVGTFYCAPEPGAAPFVRAGQKVQAGDTLCIIEVMKLMNTMSAEVDGTVVEVLVEDGKPVEYGQLLMVVEPN